jgi:hypothetical protein
LPETRRQRILLQARRETSSTLAESSVSSFWLSGSAFPLFGTGSHSAKQRVAARADRDATSGWLHGLVDADRSSPLLEQAASANAAPRQSSFDVMQPTSPVAEPFGAVRLLRFLGSVGAL